MKCLIVVDMQRDFVEPGCPVEVPGAYELGPRIRSMVDDANRHSWLTVATQDWHPPDHISFYTSQNQHSDSVHIDTPILTERPLPSPSRQPLFLPHCIADTPGARLVSSLENAEFNLHIKKGQRRESESFSAFADAQGHSTGLGEWLKAHNIDSIAIAGVATEFCVVSTALDALSKWNFSRGGSVAVVADGVAGVNAGAALHALQEVRRHGGVVVMWEEIVSNWVEEILPI